MLTRFIEILIACLLIVLISPILLLVVSILLLTYGYKNVFFKQKRIGLHEKLFTIYKLQTLYSDTERITPVGALLRKFSIDEFPQLINIIKGDMSFIGPRPLLPEYLLLFPPAIKKRHTIKPGITGWAQIHGRNEASWKERFRLDLEYLEKKSWRLNMLILFKTFILLFSSKKEETIAIKKLTVEDLV